MNLPTDKSLLVVISMRFQGVDLNSLAALEALLSEKNVTRAGQNVFISQSTMSGILSFFREYFRDDLLVIEGRRATTLTPFGELLLPQIRDLLKRTNHVLSMRSSFSPANMELTITILASDYMMEVLIPTVSAKLEKESPNSSVMVSTGRDNTRIEYFPAGILFSMEPSDLCVGLVSSCRLLSDEFVCVVSENNTDVDDQIDIARYMEMRHVIVQFVDFSGVARPTREHHFLEAMGLRRRVVASVPSFHAVGSFIRGTSRVATIPRRLAEVLCSYGLRVVRPPVAFPPMEWSLVWHEVHQETAALEWSRNLILSAASEI